MNPSTIERHSGSTMIELVVTIAILGIIASVATLAARRIASEPSDLAWLAADSLQGVVARAQAARIDTLQYGMPVSAALRIDGSIVADSEFHVDRLTGTHSAVR